MQYDSRSGNCVRSRVNGKLTSDGASFSLGMSTKSPLLAPVKIFASMTRSCRFRITNRVPLHSPFLISKLRNSITMALYLPFPQRLGNLRNGFSGGRLGSTVTKVLVCQPNLPERMSQCSAAWRSRSENEANPPCSCESAAETVFF